MQIASVGLIVKEENKDAHVLADSIKDFLQLRGISCLKAIHNSSANAYESFPQVDCVLTLGGDGTFVGVARSLIKKHIPIAGVNFGRVGFLATISPNSWQEDLLTLVETGINVESRMALQFEHIRGDKVLHSGVAINDVVLARGLYARIISFDVAIDGTKLANVRADALVMSSPTGSTGYLYSAGGPIVCPSLPVYAVAAVSSYLGSFPTLVLNAKSCCEVTAGHRGADIYLTIDGQENYAVEPGDIVRTRGLLNAFCIAEFGRQSYFEKLKGVGFIRSSHPE